MKIFIVERIIYFVLAEHFHACYKRKNDLEIKKLNLFSFILEFVTKTMFI